MKMIVFEPAGEDTSNEKNGTLRSLAYEGAYDPLITGLRVRRELTAEGRVEDWTRIFTS